ncbi:monoglyceride lipase-like [Heptranchias perlo]|uniref:monoglyceride lipase-like n=1 Tax=Heptranchias perlo TaxID=212740 RepID=UPI00355A9F4C
MCAKSCCCCCMTAGLEKKSRVTPQGLFYDDLPHFINADGNYLFCRYWEPPTPPRALVMIVYGAGEHSGRYVGVATMFVKHSLFVFTHDFVGHGQSEGERLVVSDLSVYIRDCLQHFDMMTKSHPQLKVFLFAHSMGGLIAIHVANERQDDVAGVIFIAPLVSMNPESATPIKMFCAKVMYHMFPNLSLGYLEPRLLARSQKEVRKYILDPLNYHSAYKMKFAVQVLHALIKLQKIIPTLSCPILIFHGDADKLCDIRGSILLFEKAASTDKTLKIFKKAFHQLHFDTPEVAAEVFRLIGMWLEERLPREEL